MSRRRFIGYAAATGTATAALAAGAGSAAAQSSDAAGLVDDVVAGLEAGFAPTSALADAAAIPFLHGVASGDPLPDSVVLWTRITPSRDALPGSGLGEDVTVAWEIASDEQFSLVEQSGEMTTGTAVDHTVHVDPGGLRPDTVYFYRFRVLDGEHAGATSPTGRTRTAPSTSDNNAELNLAVASCANWESGYFVAYRDMAARARRGEIDAVVFLGDYIYEYETGGYAGKTGVTRMHHPTWEITTLEDYRIRYGRYRTDPDLQAAHAAAPWVVIWDDHETANNAWREGAENHTDGVAEGPWQTRYAAAKQAYLEWLPVRVPDAAGHLYRSLRFGTLVELTMMDLRSYRDAETGSNGFADPSRTMLGSEQYQWVKSTLDASGARWNVLGNSVMMAPLKLFTIPGSDAANTAVDLLQAQGTGIALNSDQWDGYAAERSRLLKDVAAKGSQVLFLTGDIHSEWANVIAEDGVDVGVELVCTSVSAPNIDDLLSDALGIYHPQDNSTTHLVEDMITGANPWVRHLDFDAHGYSIAAIRRDDVDLLYIRVSDVEDPAATVDTAVTKTWSPRLGFTQ